MNSTPSSGKDRSDLGGAPLENITYIADLADEDGRLPPGFRLPGDPEPDVVDESDDDVVFEDDEEEWAPTGVSDDDDAMLFERWLDGRAKHVGNDRRTDWYYCHEEDGGPVFVAESPISSGGGAFADDLKRCREAMVDAADRLLVGKLINAAVDKDDAAAGLEKARAKKMSAWAEKAGNSQRVLNMLSMLMVRPTVRADADALDRVPIPALNGVVDIGPADDGFAMSFRPRTKSDLITKTTAGRYVEEAEGDRDWWRRSQYWEYLNLVLPDEDARWYYLKTVAYAAFEEGNAEQIMVILLGLTGSGKSILNDRTREALGGLATAATANALMPPKDASGHSEALFRLADYRVAFFDDLGSKNVPMDNETFKSITGTSSRPVRGMYAKEQQRELRFTAIATANRPLHIPDPDQATKRRSFYIPMNQRVTQEQGEFFGRYALKRQEERDAIITILVHAYRRYLRDKLHGVRLNRPPEIVQRCTDTAWAGSQGSVSEWAVERGYEKGEPEDYIVINAAYAEYSSFCYENGVRPLGKIKWSNAVCMMGGSRRKPDSNRPPEEQDNLKKIGGGEPVRVLYNFRKL